MLFKVKEFWVRNKEQSMHPSILKNKGWRSKGGRCKSAQEKNMNKRKILKNKVNGAHDQLKGYGISKRCTMCGVIGHNKKMQEKTVWNGGELTSRGVIMSPTSKRECK